MFLTLGILRINEKLLTRTLSSSNYIDITNNVIVINLINYSTLPAFKNHHFHVQSPTFRPLSSSDSPTFISASLSSSSSFRRNIRIHLTVVNETLCILKLQGNNNYGSNGRNFQRPSPQTTGQQQPQQQRSLNSPGSVVQTRHSPYPADQFPPPTSPNSAFNNQYLRLQRTNSAPTATTQLPGE